MVDSYFALQVYELVRQVPVGRVTTYREVAHALGCKAYRAVGRVLARNPYAPKVPCHRVVRSDGGVGGFMGKTKGEALERKSTLLTGEGIVVVDGMIIDFEQRKVKW